MSLRQKLLLVFSLTVVLAVTAVAWTISLRTREAFEAADARRTDALLTQFRHEFQRHANDISARIERLAGSDRVTRLASDIAQTGDSAPYLMEAAHWPRITNSTTWRSLASDGPSFLPRSGPRASAIRKRYALAGGPAGIPEA